MTIDYCNSPYIAYNLPVKPCGWCDCDLPASPPPRPPPLSDPPHIVSCSESELRAVTDYTLYVTVYGITDVSLSSSDVIQTGSTRSDPHKLEFGLRSFPLFSLLFVS